MLLLWAFFAFFFAFIAAFKEGASCGSIVRAFGLGVLFGLFLEVLIWVWMFLTFPG